MMKKNLLMIILMLGLVLLGQAQLRFVQRLADRRINKNSGDIKGGGPDYSQSYYWAATPYKHNYSDSIPSFIKNEKRDNRADVFYIHPTTFTANILSAPWNADLGDTTLNRQTDERPLLFQASAFNSSCRIFAPRYRQAHLKAFLMRNSDNAQKAFDLAYSDIKKAFQYYLDHDNHGRPIIIAAHSQGSMHAVRLLQEFFDGKPLQRQLVCAYVVGWPVSSAKFKHIPVGKSPGQTGCVVGWCSYQKEGITSGLQSSKNDGICVNPLTWTTSTEEASPELNDGAIFRDFNKLHLHAAGASIAPNERVLWVTLSDDWDAGVKNFKNLHVVDYNLFWMNIRENVKLRVDSFFRSH